MRTRSTTTKSDENAQAFSSHHRTGSTGDAAVKGKPTVPSEARAATAGVLGTRKRAALGDLTNAARSRHALKDKEDKDDAKKPGSMRARAPPAPIAPSARPASQLPARPAASRRVVRPKEPEAMVIDDVPMRESASGSDKENMDVLADDEARNAKRVRVAPGHVGAAAAAPAPAADAAPRAKDEGWEDLDKDDADDPLMVAEYAEEIFAYMRKVEMRCLPNGNYMSLQRDLSWHLRGVLADWLIETHAKFRLLPETLFLALNIVDRFLSLRTISLSKLQLVGVTALFIAAKYEEVLCPSIQNFLYVADGGYTDEEILRAERYMLKVLNFDMSYASPMNFLRRISKADNYDIQTRTVAKYFMEISLVDHRLIDHPPSLVAAAAVWLAREVLERGEWTPTLVHYSTYAEPELLGTAEIMLDYCLQPPAHLQFHKKYSSKKFMRASAYVLEWAKNTFPQAVLSQEDVAAGQWTDEHGEKHSLDMLRVDLYERHGHLRPSVLPLAPSADDSVAGSHLDALGAYVPSR